MPENEGAIDLAKKSRTGPLKAYGLPAQFDPQKEVAASQQLFECTAVDVQCTTPWAALKSEPSSAATTVSEVLFGEPLQILGRQDAWLKVAAIVDGYVGWVLTGTTTRGLVHPTHRISVPMAHIYRSADLKSEPLLPLPMCSYLHVKSPTAVTNGFLALETGGFIFAGHIASLGGFASDPVTIAESFLGSPYLWGGRTSMGMDCSGLVQLALAASGHRVHRDSGAQFKSLGRKLTNKEQPSRGDLAFFPGHVGWMIDSVHLLHANATNMAVTIDPVDRVTDWVRTAGTDEPFLGFRRL